MTRETLKHHMAEVAANARDPWARKFARDIWTKCNSHRWTPSPKQLGVARRLIADLHRQREDVILIDGGDV